jgi:hypothetical protein
MERRSFEMDQFLLDLIQAGVQAAQRSVQAAQVAET